MGRVLSDPVDGHYHSKAKYFISTYEVILRIMDNNVNIKNQLFERIDFQKYLAFNDNISNYKLILDDIIKCQDIFSLLGVDINTKGMKRKYNIFRAYRIIICCLADIYITEIAWDPIYPPKWLLLEDFILRESYRTENRLLNKDVPKYLKDRYVAEHLLFGYINRTYHIHKLFKKYNIYEKMKEK